MKEELYLKSVSELKSMLDSKEISSQELTKSVIDRTKAIDDKLEAYLSYNAEYAMECAKASDDRRAKGESLGALDGIPVSIKDNIADTNQPLTCASKMLENYVSPYSATVIDNLKSKGAVMWGRLNMDEFAMGSSCENSAFKKTKNPYDLERIPGGSSGGSAASVASGETICALGSDTGGSIRQPASHCNVVGLKPTYGLVSRYGLAAFASSLDQIGTFSRNVEDSAILLEAIASYDRLDSTSVKTAIPNYQALLNAESLKGKKIGIPKEYFIDGIDPEVMSIVKNAIAHCEKQGAELVEISLPHTDLAIATYYILATAEASSNLSRYDGIRYTHRAKNAEDIVDLYYKSRAEGFGEEVIRRIILGTFVLSSGYYDAYYHRAQKVRTLIRQDFEKAFQHVDAIMTPVSPTPAFKSGEKTADPMAMYLSDIFTINVNLSGVGALSVPCGFTSQKLPVGLHIITKAFDEANLLNIAYSFEQSLNLKQENLAI